MTYLDGKKYDTRTSHRICTYAHGKAGDPDYVHETLYRKRSGEYYLDGLGGEASRWHGSGGVQPLCRAWAEGWVLGNFGQTKYEEIFCPAINKEDKKRITLELRASVYAKLESLAESAGMSKTAAIEKLIDDATKRG